MAFRAVALAAVVLATSALGAQKQRLVVLNLTSSDKSLQSVAESTSELVSTELSRSKRFEIISQSDVATMLGLERQRQLLGCAKDGSSCLAELSSAFGSKWLVTGSLARLGKKLRLDLKVINTETNSTPFRDGRTFKDQEGLFDGAVAIVHQLVARDDLWGPLLPDPPPVAVVKAPTPVVEVVHEPQSANPAAPSSPSLLPWVVTGVGGAAFVAGVVFTVLAAMDWSTWNSDGYLTNSTWTLVKSTSDSFNRNIIVGSVLLGAGAAIAVAGMVWHAVEGKPAPVAVGVSSNGLFVAGSF